MTSAILCLSSYFKGAAFLQACKEAGLHVLLATNDRNKDEAWPHEYIDEFFHMPDLGKRPDITHAVAYLARSRQIDLIVALDDFDVETAAHLREHFRLPGMGDSLARNFRDKLAMRTTARNAGIRVPEFTGVFNYDDLREFMARVSPPWLLKPRSEASSMGIKKIEHADEVWPALESLGDQGSFFLMEQFVAGDVYHVDGLVDNGEVLFSMAHKYGKPPLSVYAGGGVFLTRSLDRDSEESKALVALNKQVLKAMGLVRGATHSEYIQSHADGQYYFLENAARVGGANIAECVDYASGVNLWREWARIEIANWRGEQYQLPQTHAGYAGIINCLAHQEWPDLSNYNDPEVAWRLNKKYHAGLIVASPEAARVESLLQQYAERFAQDFLAVLPPRQSFSEM
ncbi:MAG TPA: ATP-grasp domain-containing protein [Anaerolineales bacterium]|nr:ATP-grasp domain-containing protein [Anaerolineales bacterium]